MSFQTGWKPLPDVAAQLILPPRATVVHTSGSTSLDTLQYALTAPDATAGVFYPLQTFSQDVPVDMATIRPKATARQAFGLRVVPDSGTDQLTGLTGSLTIIITNGQHSYEFDYSLPHP